MTDVLYLYVTTVWDGKHQTAEKFYFLFLFITETEGSLPSSQQPATVTYPQLHEFSLYPHVCLRDSF